MDGTLHRILRTALVALVLFAAGTLAGRGVWAGPPAGPLSPEMRAISVDEQRGVQIDPALTFTDHQGRKVRLGDFFGDGKPVLFTLNYYRCKVICSVQLDGLAQAFSKLDWTAGEDGFRVVTVSIDPREGPKLAQHKRSMILEKVGRGDDVDWTFLTGDALSIRTLAAQLGVGFAYDAEQDQYAHPAVAIFASPDGTVTQYLYGLTYQPRDLKFALIEASKGQLGTPVDQLIMSCFHYDASIGRYGPFAFGIMRLGGAATALVLGIFLLGYWRFERRRKRTRSAEAKS